MKKSTIILSLSLSTLTFASGCMRKYTCDCFYTNGDGMGISSTSTYYAKSKAEANKKCTPDASSNKTCELSW